MEDSYLEDTVASYRENLQYKAKDEDLIRAIDAAIDDSKDLKEEIDKIGRKNKLFWELGTDENLATIHPAKSKVVSNRIFTDIETAIPILSANRPEPTILNVPDNGTKEIIKKALEIAYEVTYKMQQKLQTIIRHWSLFRIGILKYRWDTRNGYIVEPVLAKHLGMDKTATCINDSEFIFEYLKDTVEHLIQKFPDKKKEIEQLVGEGDNLRTKLTYTEFWGGNGEWVCWKINNIILGKSKNPNFDYKNTENNIFDSPKFPYIILNVFNLGDNTGLYDDTSLIEEATSLQVGANQLERQLLDLNEGRKRVWIISGLAMSEERSQKLVDKTGDLLVYLDRNAPASSINQVQAGSGDVSMFNNLSHLLSEIDNIIGIHSTSRGERESNETYGRSQLLVQSDYGRLDMISRNIEQMIEEWYNSYLQMIKVFSIGEVTLSDGEQSVELDPVRIPSEVQIMVKKGTTLPTDEVSQARNALELTKTGFIDPGTLFEEMGYSNIPQRKDDLYAWLLATGKIVPPQPQMPIVGQPGAAQGTPQGQPTEKPEDKATDEQMIRLQQILQSDAFKQLAPDQQEVMLGKAKEIVNQSK